MKAVERASTWYAGLAYPAAAASGIIFAAIVYQALTMELRYVAAFVAGVLLVGVGICLPTKIPDFLLYLLAFNIPFTGIEKGFLVTSEPTFVVGGVMVGLADLSMALLYVLWFARIVTGRQALPKPRLLDWCVLLFWLAHVISIFSALSSGLVVLEIIRLARYSLIYFYIAHNLEKRHLKWILLGVFFSMVLQSSLAVVQYRTGALVGIGQTKGSDEIDYSQYAVTGIETVTRAEGTTFDSHALGLFFAMTLPIALAVGFARGVSMTYRGVAWAVFFAAIPGLAACLSRASWGAFVASGGVVVWALLRGQYRHSLTRIAPGALLALVLVVIAAVPLSSTVRQRLFEAPRELLTVRFETLEMAYEIWKTSPWIGIGANNYMRALEVEYNIFDDDHYFVPPHNMPTLIATEIGVVGLIIFVLLHIAIFWTSYRLIKNKDYVIQGLGAALAGAFLALHVEGITDPIYVTNVTYFLFWFQVGLMAGIYRLSGNGIFEPQISQIERIGGKG